MDEYRNHLQDISEIRTLMEQNSKFLSLSGLSGISAGICALAGAFAAWWKLDLSIDYLTPLLGPDYTDLLLFLAVDALVVLVAAVGLAALFSIRMGKKRGIPIWNKSARYMLVNLLTPLIAGGLFCLVQVWHGSALWVAPTMLLFYGMSLLNASKYTQPEIRWLGYSEIVLGLLCAVWAGNGLVFWAIGFGILHIVYGAVMYFKYER
jgi:predicted lysophospholipase L1 biosynthesis ABC-type transport system permease subunit